MTFPLTRHLCKHKKKEETKLILEIRIIKRRKNKTHDFFEQTTYTIMNFIKRKVSDVIANNIKT